MFKFLDSASHGLARLTGWAVVALAAALVGSLLIAIFFRYAMGQALSWPEEISLMLFAWLTLLSGSLGVREDSHVRLTLLTDRLPAPGRLLMDRLSLLGVAFFGLALAFAGFDLLERTMEHLTPTLRLSLDWVNWSAPVCGLLITIHALARLKPSDRKDES